MPSMAPPYTNFLGGPVFWGQVNAISSSIAPQAPAEVRMRVAGRSSTPEPVARMTREVDCLYINGPAGGGGIRSEFGPVISVENILIPRADITPTVEIFEI